MEKNKIVGLNKLCAKCIHECKQSSDKILLGCPNYKFKPQQLEIKFKFPKKET